MVTAGFLRAMSRAHVLIFEGFDHFGVRRFLSFASFFRLCSHLPGDINKSDLEKVVKEKEAAELKAAEERQVCAKIRLLSPPENSKITICCVSLSNSHHMYPGATISVRTCRREGDVEV